MRRVLRTLYSDKTLKVKNITKDLTGNVVVAGENNASSFFVEDGIIKKTYKFDQPVEAVVDSRKENTFLILKGSGAVQILDRGIPREALMYTVENHQRALLFNLGEMKVYAGYSDGLLTFVTLSENGVALNYFEIGECKALDSTNSLLLCLNDNELRILDVENFLTKEWIEGELEKELDADEAMERVRVPEGVTKLKAFGNVVALFGEKVHIMNLFDMTLDTMNIGALDVSFDEGNLFVLENGKVSRYNLLSEKLEELEVPKGFGTLEVQRGALFLGGEDGLRVMISTSSSYTFKDESGVNEVSDSISNLERVARNVLRVIGNIFGFNNFQNQSS